MTELFLKAKHWQIFLLVFGLPVIFQIVLVTTVLSNLMQRTSYDEMALFNHIKWFPPMMIIVLGVLFGWFWAVAMGLQKKVPANVSLKIKTFKIFFFIPLVYIACILIIFSFFLSKLPDIILGPESAMLGVIVALVIPLHLFSIFCMFYLTYFTAKTFKTVELQREAEFADYIGEFFLIMFYPVGIWFIQPQVNKMSREAV